jgi:hypothetical protein
MMGPEIVIPVTGIICLFGLPIWTSHQRKMMELRLRVNQEGDQSVLTELQSLRAQMTDLRDTTTRYDMSFDAALQRIESRVGHLETRVAAVEQGETATQRTGTP